MPTFQMIPVDALVEPANRQRSDTLLERIDELRESIRLNGLQQPIGVLALPHNQYRIIWGERRSIAVTQLQWMLIPAMVYEIGEADEDQLMGAENYHRNNTSDAEEAEYYARMMPREPEGTIGLARKLNVPQSRIENLLLCQAGDEKVFAAMRQRKISLAQACEINKFKSPGYRLQALERASVEGTSAYYLGRWRKEIQRQGIDQDAADQQANWSTPLPGATQEPMDLCTIGNHQTPLHDRKIYSICNAHYNVFLEGLEWLGRIRTIEEAGLLPKMMRLLREAEAEHGTT